MRDKSVVRLSVTPSTKYSCSGSPPILAKGSTTMERRGAEDGVGACGTCSAGLLAPLRPNLQRIDPHRLGDVLEFGRPRSLTARSSRVFTCR